MELAIYTRERARLWSLAYRMLGTASEAEDILQDAYIRSRSVDTDAIDNPSAYLTTIVSRLCIDRLRAREKEAYVGPWLPEPVYEDDSDRWGAIHTAFLHLLERLNPKERAVFILKEAFDYDHREVSEVLAISEASSRQLLRRARQRLGRIEDLEETQDPRPAVNRFVAALMADDLDGVESLLSGDVIAFTDGGGVVSAAIIPLAGVERIKTVFGHLFRKFEGTAEYEWRWINGSWGLVTQYGDGTLTVTTFLVKAGRIHRIYVVRNPHKLSHVSSATLAGR